MQLKTLVSLAWAMALFGCPPSPPPSESESATTGDTGSSDGATSVLGGDETTAASQPASSGGDDATFFQLPDVAVGFECDIFAQDCPAGQKCTPWADDGGLLWNGAVCREVDGNAQHVGDLCTVQGTGTSGLDDCALGAMCWDVDPKTGTGTCVSICEGSPANPWCDAPGTTCILGNDGALALCLPQCDPLLQDCIAGQACYAVSGEFACAPDTSGAGGLSGDPCSAVNDCDAGLLCLTAEVVANCGGDACCTPLCDVTAEAANRDCHAAGAGQSCEAYYQEGEAPPGGTAVGLCVVPQ